MTKYCKLCKRFVEPKRKIGAGTVIGVMLTGGIWLLAIPFYQKRCPICNGTALSNEEVHTIQNKANGVKQVNK